MGQSRRNIKKLCIVSGTRADWGLLSPLAHRLEEAGCELTVIATNMHLSERFGLTVNDIEADGFSPVRVEMDCDDDSPLGRAKAMASCLSSTASVFGRLKPDMAIMLGDRYEILAVASAAAIMRVPVVHIAGGTVSEGAIDDNIRHAVTKLSALHLTETETYRRRIIAMGENPERVINTGAIGVWSIKNFNPLSRDALGKDLGFDLSRPFAVATFHPATLDDTPPSVRVKAMLDALDRHPSVNILLTYPNNDAGSAAIIDEIERFASARTERVKLVKSLGAARYLSALNYAVFSIGNSSSGIVEVPSFGIPSIDIGIRQKGRASAESVIHCGDSADEISAAIDLALSEDFRALARDCDNPYYNPDTPDLMVKAILDADPKDLVLKHFYDIDRC